MDATLKKEIRKSSRPELAVFKNCSTVEQKLDKLAELFADALEWRTEESDLLRQFRQRLEAFEFELVQDDGPNTPSYMMKKEADDER